MSSWFSVSFKCELCQHLWTKSRSACIDRSKQMGQMSNKSKIVSGKKAIKYDRLKWPQQQQQPLAALTQRAEHAAPCWLFNRERGSSWASSHGETDTLVLEVNSKRHKCETSKMVLTASWIQMTEDAECLMTLVGVPNDARFQFIFGPHWPR